MKIAYSLIVLLCVLSQAAEECFDCRKIEPIQLALPEFKNHLKMAEEKDANSLFCLGWSFFHGTGPNKEINYDQAEKWLLNYAISSGPKGFAYLVDVALKKKNIDTLLLYAEHGADALSLSQLLDIADFCSVRKERKHAKHYYSNAHQYLMTHKSVLDFTKWYPIICTKYAKFLLVSPLSDERANAFSLFEKLADEGDIDASYNIASTLCESYWSDVELRGEAFKYLSKILKSPLFTLDHPKRDGVYRLMGYLHEYGYNKMSPNISKALQYYDKSKNTSLYRARLVLTNRIKGDRNKAKADILQFASSNIGCAYLYGSALFAEGAIAEAVTYMEKLSGESPLSQLQIAIAYHYGFGVDKNREKAKHYFGQIIEKNTKYDPTRALQVARGYIHLLGLGGVKADITAGLALLDAAEKMEDNVYFLTEDLFPIVKKFREQQQNRIIKELCGPTRKKKKKKSVNNQQSEISNVSSQSSVDEEITKNESNPFLVNVNKWNKYFKTSDESYVENIDANNCTFVIHDSKRDEELIVKGDTFPNRDFTEIKALTFHPRIFERQGLTGSYVNHSVAYDHSFAEMLDYVIQYTGEYVPFMKSSRDSVEDQLVASVVRKDIKTGHEILTRAEYTFGQKNNDAYVYHRLLRPLSQRNDICDNNS